MDEESLHDLVQFLSEATLTDITAVGNTKVENTELGTQWRVSLFVHVDDPGDSWLFRSKIGPSAAIKTDKHEVLEDGVQLYDQTLSSALEDGYAVISLYCQNTRFVIVEDV